MSFDFKLRLLSFQNSQYKVRTQLFIFTVALILFCFQLQVFKMKSLGMSRNCSKKFGNRKFSAIKVSVKEIPLLNRSLSSSAMLEQHDTNDCKRKKNKQREDDYQLKVSVTHRTSKAEQIYLSSWHERVCDLPENLKKTTVT